MACETEGQDIPKYRANSIQNTFPTACASSQTTTGQIFTSPHMKLSSMNSRYCLTASRFFKPMGKYFIPILPGLSPATNQNTVPGPPIPVSQACQDTHFPHQIPKGGLLLVQISNTCSQSKKDSFQVDQESHSGRSRQERYLVDSNPW
jgi:hypothetical protein